MNLNPLKWFSKKEKVVEHVSDELSPAFSSTGSGSLRAPSIQTTFDGDKFAGGFGVTELFDVDYWTLRQRSNQMFTKNLYAKGLLKRLLTNEINTGLVPESTPDEKIMGVSEDSMVEWAESVEDRFTLWGKNPLLCDIAGLSTFGALQRKAKLEAYIEGDILVTLRPSRKTGLPMVQLVRGDRVVQPAPNQKINSSNEVRHGVETNPDGKHVAYYVKQADGKIKRVPAFGEKSGRRLAWMVYGTDLRVDGVRGEPLLSVILQSLNEIDRYRDAAVRKAVVTSILAMFIKKGENKMSSLAMSGGAVKNSDVTVTDSDGGTRDIEFSSHLPGLVLQTLQHGEDIIMKGGEGTDINFGAFEASIINAIAWANEIPPEILTLAFSNNYSASQAAINEFKIYLNKVREDWGDTFCSPIYIEWLVAETLLDKIQAPKLLESMRNPAQYDIFGAIVSAEWYGSIKPSTDMLKQAKGSKLLVSEGWSTNRREARGNTGTSFNKNIKRLKRENILKVEAQRPLAEFEQEFGRPVEEPATASELELDQAIDDYLVEKGVIDD